MDEAPEPRHLFALGLCLLRLGKPAEAIQAFESARSKNPWGCESYLGLTLGNTAAGNGKEAADWLETAQKAGEDLALIQHPIDRMTCQLLFREAEQLIEPNPTSEDDAGEKIE